MWMNLGQDFAARAAGKGRVPAALADIAALEKLWAEARQKFAAAGPFLFGASFGAADVMFAPVVTRLLTWRPEISAATRAYCDAVRAHPLVDEWYRDALEEPDSWCLTDYETLR
jgi:glutathione S-transferase